MALTKLYQVVQFGLFHTVWKTARTEQECLAYLEGGHITAFEPIVLTVIPIWTNGNEKDIEKMLRGH